ncbi:MAG: hypothetical protein IH624_01610 [Phycisphaerae bacterium]|nr:hypothetical protein [Phycisphaerae bacterium]
MQAKLTVLILLVACMACSCRRTGDKNTSEPAAANSHSAPQFRPMAKNLRELMIDIAESHACRYLNGRIMLLSAPGAQAAGSREPDTGNLWIYGCHSEQTDPNTLRVEIKGKGWKWIEQDTQTVGAAFTVQQIVLFEVTMSMTGTFDMVYDPAEHIATVYFVPTAPVEAEFEVTSDIDVQTESPWSWIVGQSASWTGQSLQKRAVEEIRNRAVHRIIAKLEHGFTIIVDLCTGNSYTKFGTFEPGKLPEPATDAQPGDFQVNSRAVLYADSLLMAGPFEPDKGVLARFENGGNGGFQAWWLCQNKAKEIAWDYVADRQASITDALSTITVQENETTEFSLPATNCPVVLVMRPIDGTPVSYNYTVVYAHKRKQPFIDCSQSSAVPPSTR